MYFIRSSFHSAHRAGALSPRKRSRHPTLDILAKISPPRRCRARQVSVLGGLAAAIATELYGLAAGAVGLPMAAG
jgi:hypothetical protein